MSREWNGSQVMGEFAKIAAESGLITTDLGKQIVGNPDKSPVGPFRNNPSVSGKTDTLSVDRNSKDYGITKETGEELVNKAHPEDPEIAESMGMGWLVENENEQQEADVEVATSMPSGALPGKHAALMSALVALANELEGEGKAEAAARVDRTIERLAALPFGNGLRKEAFFAALLAPLAKVLMWGGIGAGAWRLFGTKLTSTRESLAEDIRDVLEVGASVGESPSLAGLARQLRDILAPYAARFKRPMPSLGDKAELDRYATDLDDFERDFGKAASIVDAMTAVPDEWYKFGFGAKSRLQEKFADLRKTLADTRTAIGKLSGTAQQMMAAGPAPSPEAGKAETPIAAIQALLAERGFDVPRSGRLDDATKDALRQLAGRLDEALRRKPEIAEILDRRGWNISDSVLRPDGKVMDPANLRRLIALSES